MGPIDANYPSLPGRPNKENCQVVDKARIKAMIDKLQPFKSPGITQIPMAYYKWLDQDILDPLEQWFKTLEQNHTIPWILKIDIKSPIPKFNSTAPLNDQINPEKYRPIALGNSMYKILDGNLKIALEEHNEEHGIILPNQGGFKSEEGTIEHLYVMENLFHYNKTLYGAFLDFKKAFD